MSTRHISLFRARADRKCGHNDLLPLSQSGLVEAYADSPTCTTSNGDYKFNDDSYCNTLDLMTLYPSLSVNIPCDKIDYKGSGYNPKSTGNAYSSSFHQAVTRERKTADKERRVLGQVVFVCVKYGAKYGAEYVNNLFGALKKGTIGYYSKNADKSHKDHFRLVCYTDDPSGVSDGVEVQLIPRWNVGQSRSPVVLERGGKDKLMIPTLSIPLTQGEIDLESHHVIRTTEAAAVSALSKKSDVGTSRIEDFLLTEGMKNWSGWWLKAYLFYAVNDLETTCKLESEMFLNSPHNDYASRDERANDDDDGDRIEENELMSETLLGLNKTEMTGTPSKDVTLQVVHTELLSDRPVGEKSEVEEEESHPTSDPMWVFYMDLDTVIKGPLDFLFDTLLNSSPASPSPQTFPSPLPSSPDSPGSFSSFSSNDSFEGSAISPKEKEVKLFYTLGAAHFESEARPCGINSSIMIWQTTPRHQLGSCEKFKETILSESERGWTGDITQEDEDGAGRKGGEGETNGRKLETHTERLESVVVANNDRDHSGFEQIFTFLLDNYESVTSCVHKFDHYLEMMLLNSMSDPVSIEKVSETLRDDHIGVAQLRSNARAHQNETQNDNEWRDLLDIRKGKRKEGNPSQMFSKEKLVKVLYLQDLTHCKEKIVDFSNLLIASSTGKSLPESIPTCSSYQSRLNFSSPSDSDACAGEKSIKLRDDALSFRKYESSYIHHNLFTSASIICFPLQPKPHEVAVKEDWMKDLWEGRWDDSSQ